MMPVTPPAVIQEPEIASSVLTTMIGKPAPQIESEPGKEEANETMLVSSRVVVPLPLITIKYLPNDMVLKSAEKISNFPFIIGRSEGDLNLQDPSISRKHIKITFDTTQQKYYVTDLGSKNGSTLNGESLAANEPACVEFGSIIGLGPNMAVLFDHA